MTQSYKPGKSFPSGSLGKMKGSGGDTLYPHSLLYIFLITSFSLCPAMLLISGDNGKRGGKANVPAKDDGGFKGG